MSISSARVTLDRSHAVAVGTAALAVDDAVHAFALVYPCVPAVTYARAAVFLAAQVYVEALTDAGVGRPDARDALRGLVRRALTHRAGGAAQALLDELQSLLACA